MKPTLRRVVIAWAVAELTVPLWPLGSVLSFQLARRLSKTAFIIVLLALCGKAQTSEVVVKTTSMEPGLLVDDVLIVDEGYYLAKNVQRFDIVVFKHPMADFKAVARVIALGGETVAINSNGVLINGKSLKEPFKTRPCRDEKEDRDFPCANFGSLKVPEGEFFLLADNRRESLDSRMFNPHTITQGQLIGKVIRISSKRSGSPRTAVAAIGSSAALSSDQ